MARSRPPSYDRKRVCIDFDGVIAPWGPLFDQPAPATGVATAMQDLRLAGYHIIIWTSRLSEEWWAWEAAHRRNTNPLTFGLRQRQYVETYLAEHGIVYDEIVGKPQARVYFDDRAWRTNHTTLAADLTKLVDDGRMDTDV